MMPPSSRRGTFVPALRETSGPRSAGPRLEAIIKTRRFTQSGRGQGRGPRRRRLLSRASGHDGRDGPLRHGNSVFGSDDVAGGELRIYPSSGGTASRRRRLLGHARAVFSYHYLHRTLPLKRRAAARVTGFHLQNLCWRTRRLLSWSSCATPATTPGPSATLGGRSRTRARSTRRRILPVPGHGFLGELLCARDGERLAAGVFYLFVSNLTAPCAIS